MDDKNSIKLSSISIGRVSVMPRLWHMGVNFITSEGSYAFALFGKEIVFIGSLQNWNYKIFSASSGLVEQTAIQFHHLLHISL